MHAQALRALLSHPEAGVAAREAAVRDGRAAPVLVQVAVCAWPASVPSLPKKALPMPGALADCVKSLLGRARASSLASLWHLCGADSGRQALAAERADLTARALSETAESDTLCTILLRIGNP